MKTKLSKKISSGMLLVVSSFARPALAELPAGDSLRIETFKTHSRIVVRVDESVSSEWKNTAEGFELLLKGIGLMDLGAPLGEEEAWKSRLEAQGDARIAGLKLVETGGNLKIQGKWKYPKGSAAPATPRMEAFDYRDKNPPQLVVDLWLKKGPTLAEIGSRKGQLRQLRALEGAEKQARARAERRLASLQRKAEGEDLGRFCRQPLSERTDVFLPFLPLHEPVNYSRWMATTTPDSHFVYFEPKGKDRDAQYVRLALALYRQGKPALVSRTLEFHESEHPGSPYRQEMRFLKANALLKVGMEKEAEEILARLMVDAKDSPVALHSGMFLAARRAMKDGGHAALEPFLWLISNYPQNRLAWLFHLGAAEIYYSMRQVERALKEYQWVMEFAPERRHQAEAASRAGDIYLQKLQYEQAFASYSEGLRYFEKELEEFPSIHVNRAEALYQIGQYERAKEGFEAFLKKFPAHPAGWRATFRLGEIAGRAGDAQARARYLETINRHPFSPGATLARLRLITCGDQGGFSAAAGEKFFETEAEAFGKGDGQGEVVLTRYRELKGLARVRALVAWGRDDRAVEAAAAEIEANRGAELRSELSSMLSVLYRKRIRSLLAEGRKYDAIAFFQEKSRFLPEEARLAEPEYLLSLSRAAADLRMGKLAGELAAVYEKAAAQARGPASGAGAPEAAVLPEAAALDDTEKQMRDSEERFTQAKALWIARAPDSDSRIRALLQEVREESPFSYERELILGLMAEAKGRFEEARAHALRAQLLQPAQAKDGAQGGQRIRAWLAGLEAKAGDLKSALEMIRGLEERAGTDDSWSSAAALGVPPVPTREALVFAQAGILEKLGRWGEAASAYSRLVDGGQGGGQATYGFARALLRSAERRQRAKGLEMLEQLAQKDAAPEGIYWKKLAMETLANERNRESQNAKEGRK
ncbi:MAG: tetratricopeptide repeat protein [Oligoflexia bacterium]|nr:tetratricopeptide repeat protein [Oligoflexia bacterium]